MDAPHEAFPLPEGRDEGYIVANGVRLHYVAAGSGPLALLLHGFPEFWLFEPLRLSFLVARDVWLSPRDLFVAFRRSYPGSVVKWATRRSTSAVISHQGSCSFR